MESFSCRSSDTNQIVIPLGGNCFVTKRGINPDSEKISSKGLHLWSDSESICTIFFKIHQPESFNLYLRLKVPRGISTFKASLGSGDTSQEYLVKDLENREFRNVPVAQIVCNQTCPEYLQLNLQGITKTGESYADISHLILENIKGKVQFIEHPDNFYFGRRGPSVHLRFKPPTEKNIEYFYNEIKVPEGQDQMGAYFMANGFSEGYFGIQVNSPTERRVLFSVWSDYKTDDPCQVPDDYKVQLIKKGFDVLAQEFGDEGSGMQSILQYNWKSETTYRFLLFGCPCTANSCTFTAWFSSEVNPEWQLIASFWKPKKSVYLTSLYSFAENFIPETGHLERQAWFGNQWIRTASENKWYEITKAVFTGDATSKKDRSDFAGGSVDNNFFLRHCGYFSDYVKTDQQFVRQSSGPNPPNISFPSLP